MSHDKAKEIGTNKKNTGKGKNKQGRTIKEPMNIRGFQT
jgi:hypothetical protein